MRFLGSCCNHCGQPCSSIEWCSRCCASPGVQPLPSIAVAAGTDGCENCLFPVLMTSVVIFLGALPQEKESMFHKGGWNVKLYYEGQFCGALAVLAVLQILQIPLLLQLLQLLQTLLLLVVLQVSCSVWSSCSSLVSAVVSICSSFGSVVSEVV